MTNEFPKIEQGYKKLGKLENLFGKNFSPEKTIILKKDVGPNNESRELKHEASWNELVDPETGEVVEAKVYMPEGQNVEKLLIVSPGYRGDFVLQEGEYADDFAKDGRAVIFLRHNGLRITGEGVDNYVHCPEKTEQAETSGLRYTGKKDFSFAKGNQEVLTALMSLRDKIGGIKKIDIVGHSWGGHIAINSLVELEEKAQKTSDELNMRQAILEKIDNCIVLGNWVSLENEEMKEAIRGFFKNEEQADFYKNLNADQCIDDMIKSGKRLLSLKSEDWPSNVRLIDMHSHVDGDVISDEIYKLFDNLKGIKRKGALLFKDFSSQLPPEIGNRSPEIHDYSVSQARGWIKQAIDKN